VFGCRYARDWRTANSEIKLETTTNTVGILQIFLNQDARRAISELPLRLFETTWSVFGCWHAARDWRTANSEIKLETTTNTVGILEIFLNEDSRRALCGMPIQENILCHTHEKCYQLCNFRA
jgi:hypothetical protein